MHSKVEKSGGSGQLVVSGLAVLLAAALFLLWWDAHEAPLVMNLPKQHTTLQKKALKRPSVIPMRVVKIEREQEKKAKPRSRPITISSATAQKTGQKVLREGNTPTLEGRIAMPFGKYLAYIERAGGKLVVFERQDNRVVGRLEQGRFITDMDVSGYARRARDVTMDIPAPLQQRYLQAVRFHRGAGAYRLLILFPDAREEQFVGTIAELLQRKGFDISTVDSVSYSYHQKDGRLLIVVQHVTRGGKKLPVEFSAYLWS